MSDLVWLANPTELDRANLAVAASAEPIAALKSLQRLSQRNWSESDLAAMGRKIRKLQGSVDATQLRESGLTAYSLLIISSDTSSHLADALRATALRAGFLMECRIAEYVEPESWIAEHREELAATPPSATLIFLSRKALGLRSALGDQSDADACVARALSRMAGIVSLLRGASRFPVIVQNLPWDPSDPQASVDGWLSGTPRQLLRLFNDKLSSQANELNFSVFDVAGLAELVGAQRFSAGRYWYVAKLPFSTAIIPMYAHRLMQLIAASHGKSRRVLVLDLDNTLWGGIVGDDGVQGLVLGKGNARGEAHLALQVLANSYRDRGVILAIASKNTESVALEAFRDHPEMLLKEDDISDFRINWDDKASNIYMMSKTLNLGLDAFVFVDDNPVERKQVRDALPDVAVPELPEDPAAWIPIIQAANYFEQATYSSEDRSRTALYKANAARTAQAASIGDPREFLKTLSMQMTIGSFSKADRPRIAQLINKSNQFNLTTRRYSEGDVAAWQDDRDAETIQVRLVDAFGDNGLISVVILRKAGPVWDIDTWVMSCRVLGREVERAVLKIIAERAVAQGALEVRGTYIPTAKNGLVREHYAKLGFEQIGCATQASETQWRLVLADFVPPQVPMEITKTFLNSEMPNVH